MLFEEKIYKKMCICDKLKTNSVLFLRIVFIIIRKIECVEVN